MDISEGTATEDLWTPYKELVAVVEGYLTREGNGPPYAVHTFEAVLRRHKQTFLSLLKNPPKNPTSRDEIRRGISEGVNLPSIGRTLLSKELVEEAIILSDMYSVNEYLSLELVHTAQRQAPRHPGLPRGLVAVVLYYDGKRSLAQALKEIVMAQDGVSWSINARDEIIKYVTRYVEQLVSGGLLGACLDALQTFSLGAELELLQANRALPPRSHYAPLVDTIETTRKLLAGVVFAASAQRGLSRDILLRLLAEQTNAAGQREFDEISLSLHMALLYALDLSVLHRREDGEELAKKLPLIQDPELISALLDELAPPTNPNQSAADAGEKTSSGIRALCQLSLGLALAALKRAPQSLLRSSGQELRADLLDHDEALVDAAVDGKVFEYIDEVLLSTTAGAVVREEYYQRRLHALLTDFVLLMHSKLTEMRVKADEASRAVLMYSSEGVAAPPSAAAARSRFDAFLRCIEKLYQNDPRRLRDDYWQACDTVQSHTYRSGGRSATLYKLVRLLCSLSGGTLSRGLRALASLAAPPAWPLLCGAPVSAHHLLTALLAYRQNLRVDANPFSDQLQASSLGATAIVTPAARPGRLQVRQEEVEAMMAALKVIAAVAREDQAACIAICENLQWDAVNVMFGLISCHIPLQLKAELCLTLAALGGYAATAPRVAAALDAAQLVSSDSRGRGLAADLAEVECRIEEYPLSRAFLTLLISLSKNSPMALAGAALEPCTRHALELALRHQHRSYAKPVEKTQILSLCLELLVLWLSSYTPSSADLTGRAPPPLHVALRLHSGDELLRMILTTLREAVDELPNRGPQQPYIEKCAIHCLQLLERGLAMERALAQAAGAAGRALVVVGLSKLLLGVPKEECPLLAACRALSTPAVRVWAPAVALLTRCCSPAAAARLLPHADTFTRHGFVEVLEADEWAEGAGDSLRQAKEGILQQATDLIESCYRLVHQLCARPATAPPALRFLRTREHFLCRHLQATVNLENATPATLSSRSWVLRACAHEAGAAARDHSALATLLRATHQPQQEWERCLLRRALLGLPVVVAPAPEPRWELFHATQLRAALAQCDVTTGTPFLSSLTAMCAGHTALLSHNTLSVCLVFR
ncbi:hypothetical protein JYU34_010716 [Plutella xylostella]|uniref:Nuclear pore complex protein Nup205 n=1 Tax=Plutella xylostella TaxID=51655 RepID=A0ABQ7QF34_PLUXY|nr:hypothetical protein JYU34_010716 [Plutella xylostella]